MQKVLCRLKVADIGADLAGRSEADLRVHVCAVHVNLSAARVDELADLDDRFLENAVRARISHHERGELILVLIGLRGQVGQVDIAIGEARDRDDAHAGHDRAGGIRPVRAGRDQADVAMRLAARAVIFSNDEESRVFARRAGIRLQRDAREASDFREPALELLAHFGVARGLLGRREGMQLAEFRPRHGQHLAGRVQLHRARAERDHRGW